MFVSMDRDQAAFDVSAPSVPTLAHTPRPTPMAGCAGSSRNWRGCIELGLPLLGGWTRGIPKLTHLLPLPCPSPIAPGPLHRSIMTPCPGWRCHSRTTSCAQCCHASSRCGAAGGAGGGWQRGTGVAGRNIRWRGAQQLLRSVLHGHVSGSGLIEACQCGCTMLS